MAVVTITRQRNDVFGAKRAKLLTINIANTGDTLPIGSFARSLDGVFCDSASATAVNASISGQTITFAYSGGGPQSAVNVLVLGK